MTKVILFPLHFLLSLPPCESHNEGMFHHYTHAHIANIMLHIVGGSAAIIAGFIAIVSRKRGLLHARAGMIFVYAYGIVILTAVLGVVVFEFRSFLAVATIASSYDVFSGYRAVKLRGRRPAPIDRAVASIALLSPVLFISAIRFLSKPWSPILTWTILGSLLLMSAYDLLRGALPADWLQRSWVYEHLFKMIWAFDALTATFAATIFPHFQPWSSLIPNFAGIAVIIGFFVAGPRAWSGNSDLKPPSPVYNFPQA